MPWDKSAVQCPEPLRVQGFLCGVEGSDFGGSALGGFGALVMLFRALGSASCEEAEEGIHHWDLEGKTGKAIRGTS